MREILTDLLDTLALVAMATGLGMQAAGWTAAWLVGSSGLVWVPAGAGVFLGGLVVLGGSWLASRPTRTAPTGDDR